MAVNTFKISDLTQEVVDNDNDFLEISRDNGDSTFSSYKVPASDLGGGGGGGGVAIGQALLQIKDMPLDENYLRLDGSVHLKASYPDIESFFPTASDWGLGATVDTGTPILNSSRESVSSSPDGSKIYVVNDDLNIRIYQKSDYSLIKTIDLTISGFNNFIDCGEIKKSGNYIVFCIRGDSSLGDAMDSVILLNTITDTIAILPDSRGGGVHRAAYNYCGINKYGTKIAYVSRSSYTDINLYDIATESIELTFTVSPTSYEPKDLDFDINDRIYSHNGSGFVRFYSYGPLGGVINDSSIAISDFSSAKALRCSRVSDHTYFFAESNVDGSRKVYKVNNSDFSIASELEVSFRVNDIEESALGDYIFVGETPNPGRNLSVYTNDFSVLIQGFQDTPGHVFDISLAGDSSSFTILEQDTPYLRVYDQNGSTDEFVISDITSPYATFEYRMKAK